MNQMSLKEYADIHGQYKAADDFGVYQCAISKAIRAGRNIIVTILPDGSVRGEEIRPFPGGNKRK